VAAGAPRERIERTFDLDDVTAPQQARSAVAEFDDLDEATLIDLRIVISELVANAVRHAPRIPKGRVRICIARDAGNFVVEVHDPGAGFQPTHDPSLEGGLGLVMVGQVAESWGIDGDGHTTVWCRLRAHDASA